MALFVEALMMRTVRRLWDLKTGAPAPNSDVIGWQRFPRAAPHLSPNRCNAR